MIFNMFHGTLQPLAGAARTLAQLAEDGLLPRVLALRSRTDTPWVATLITAGMAILLLLTGDPTWVIAAANMTYLISICLPSIAVWLLRRNAPEMVRPYRAPRGTITLGVIAAVGWGVSAILGFEQFGLPTVVAGLALAYSGSILYAWRRWSDRRLTGQKTSLGSLHVKLTGAMLLVLVLDSTGYLLAVSKLNAQEGSYNAALQDIFVAVAILTVTVGLVLPGMIAHAASELARAADRLASGTLADLVRAMQALEAGRIDEAHAHIDIEPVIVHSHDEISEMAFSFNIMQAQVAETATALNGAREGLRQARDELQEAHDELAALAITDPLTGLPNHRALVAALDQELDRARRFNHPCAVLFVDLDHFKALNDSCGHAAGDAALHELGVVMRSCVRRVDVIGRWGGEEFLALLRETTEQAALEVAERIRAAIAAYVFSAGGGMHLTSSLGVAIFPNHALDRSALVEAADLAMYVAKKLGRNQIRSASDPTTISLEVEKSSSSREEEKLFRSAPASLPWSMPTAP